MCCTFVFQSCFAFGYVWTLCDVMHCLCAAYSCMLCVCSCVDQAPCLKSFFGPTFCCKSQPFEKSSFKPQLENGSLLALRLLLAVDVCLADHVDVCLAVCMCYDHV